MTQADRKVERTAELFAPYRQRIIAIDDEGRRLACDDIVFRATMASQDELKKRDVDLVLLWILRAHFFRLALGIRRLLDSQVGTHSLIVLLKGILNGGLGLFKRDTFIRLYCRDLPAWQLERDVTSAAAQEFDDWVGSTSGVLPRATVESDLCVLEAIRDDLLPHIDNSVAHYSRSTSFEARPWREFHEAISKIEKVVDRYYFIFTQTEKPSWCDSIIEAEAKLQVGRLFEL